MTSQHTPPCGSEFHNTAVFVRKDTFCSFCLLPYDLIVFLCPHIVTDDHLLTFFITLSGFIHFSIKPLFLAIFFFAEESSYLVSLSDLAMIDCIFN